MRLNTLLPAGGSLCYETGRVLPGIRLGPMHPQRGKPRRRDVHPNITGNTQFKSVESHTQAGSSLPEVKI